jgi:DNA polymerase-3 subunit delta'
MSWQGLMGHDEIAARFRRALAGGRLASTFLFVGPAGIGKRSFALKLAQSVLCERVPETDLAPCGQCPACLQVLAGTHPDVEVVAKPADRAFIPLEALIGDDEHRMREGMCYNIALKPYSGKRKIAILDDADYLNKEGANCLLKTLEEPPLGSLIILIGTSEQRQLPTIRSRCQVVRFRPLAANEVAQLLLSQGHVANATEAERAAALAQGSLEAALHWLEPEFSEFRSAFLDYLSAAEAKPADFVKSLSAFVEAGGKEAAAKRARLKEAAGVAEQFYAQLVATIAGQPSAADPELTQAAQRAARWFPANTESAARCRELCLEAVQHVEANANQANVIEWWLDELFLAGSGLGTSR